MFLEKFLQQISIMNIINSVRQREFGKSFEKSLDIPLQRLKPSYGGYIPSQPDDSNSIGPTFACKFSNKQGSEHILALANEDGKVVFFDAERKCENNPSGGFEAHNNAIFDLAWIMNENKLLTASGDHSVALWDADQEMTKLTLFEGHKYSVKTIDISPGGNSVFATGGRGGYIMIWDARSSCNKPEKIIQNSHTMQVNTNRKSKGVLSALGVTSIVFQDSCNLISCGGGDGIVKLWDLRKYYFMHDGCRPEPKYKFQYEGPSGLQKFSSLLLDKNRVRLYINCLDGHILRYNLVTYDSEPDAVFHEHSSYVSSYYVKPCLSPDDRYLISGSLNSKAFIWDTSQSGIFYYPIFELNGHVSEVTNIAWCKTGDTKIVTCSDDAIHYLWNVGKEEDEDQKAEAECIKGFVSIPDMCKDKSRDYNHSKCKIGRLKSHLKNYFETEHCSSFCCIKPKLNKIKENECQNLSSKSSTNSSSKRSLNKIFHSEAKRKKQSSRKVLSPIKENECNRIEITPTKPILKLFTDISPFSDNYELENSEQEELSSPTMNLPNYGIDGTSPRHLCSKISPQLKNKDWLTKLIKENPVNKPKTKRVKRKLINSKPNIGSPETMFKFLSYAKQQNV